MGRCEGDTVFVAAAAVVLLPVGLRVLLHANYLQPRERDAFHLRACASLGHDHVDPAVKWWGKKKPPLPRTPGPGIKGKFILFALVPLLQRSKGLPFVVFCRS